MNSAVRALKSRLKGTWVHHTVWTHRNPQPTERSVKYDWQTVEVMFRVLRRNSSCIDVGAHYGNILCHMIEIAPLGKHYAFEPLPHLARKLTERYPGVVVHEAAVGDVPGESEFLFVENDPAYSGLRRRIYYRPDPKIRTIHVPVVTLDEVIPRDEKIAFIKLDIEGGEFHAIKGGVETIRRGKPIIVFEGGSQSIGQYGIEPAEVFFLVNDDLAYDLSTMDRWLTRQVPLFARGIRGELAPRPRFLFHRESQENKIK
jgi:FkbM family methyltransferase